MVPGNTGGRPPHEPTPETREKAVNYAAGFIPHTHIAALMGISAVKPCRP